MNKQQLARLNTLCGKCEKLQGELSRKYGEAGRKAENKERAYQAVAKAKDCLLDAIRAMEDA